MIIKIEEALRIENSIFIDVRSESEYADSHIPGALSVPILPDGERSEVGKTYKELGKAKAVELGLEYVSPRLKEIYSTFEKIASENKTLILYCARGGMRSRSVYNFLSSLGLKLMLVEGGFKAYRNHVLEDFPRLVESKDFIVLHGRTGSGKSLLLKKLGELGIPCLDLEGLAKNSGSVFGTIPFDKAQPKQGMFENLLYSRLYSLPERIVVESESRRIGRLIIPSPLFEKILEDRHVLLETSMNNRVDNIRTDYLGEKDDEDIIAAIRMLKKRLGTKTTEDLVDKVVSGEHDFVIEVLMRDYYDPMYDKFIGEYSGTYHTEIFYKTLDEAAGLVKKIYDGE